MQDVDASFPDDCLTPVPDGPAGQEGLRVNWPGAVLLIAGLVAVFWAPPLLVVSRLLN